MRMERTSLPSPLPRVDILEIQNTEMLAAAEERPFYGSVSTLAALLASLNQSSNATPRRFMDDNTSLDVNIGDGGSCHMSDVSSLSCQNVTQDDIDSLDCDLNASAGNVVDSSSERSDSPIEFERDEEEDLESSAFSSCLEMELRMRETDPSGILLTTEEDIKDFMNNAETFDTDTVKRQNKRIAEQLETDRLQMVLADKQSADADPWCSADDEDNDFYHYKPPVGLRLNGIIGSYSSLNSSSGSHVTLEFSSSLVKQTIPKIRRSPGLARRVDGPGSKVDFGADDNDINEKSCAILDNSSNGVTQDVQSSNSMQKKTKQILPVQEICVDSGIGDDMANESRSTDKEETGSVENKELEERVTHNGLDHMNEAKSEHEALLSELVESAKKLTENVLLASSASTKVSDETLTEISLNGSDRAIGDCKAFSLSPEATDCDSADVASVLSEDGKSSVTGMPLVEDGLSSSQCSDTEEIPPRARMHVSLAEGDVQNKSKYLKQLDDDKQSASTGEVESVVDVVKNGISGKRKGKHVTLAAPEYFKREDFKEISDTNIDITNECGRIIKYVAEECLSDQEEFDKFKKEINKKDAIKEDDAEDKLDENDYQEIDSILTEKEPKKEEVEAAASALDGDGMSVKDEKVDIHELTQSPVNRASQAEKGRPTRSYEGERESFLIEGVLFRARYLGSTQLISEGQPSKAMRMMQAQEAIGRIKEPPVEGDTHPSTLVDLFVSVEKIMVLNTDLQEIMMDHALRTISYIADIGDVLVVMARRGPVGTSPSSESRNPDIAAISQTKICCHVFESDEAQLIAQSISQAFQVAYIEFLKANGINDPDLMKEMDYQDVLSQQEIFGEELFLFSNKDMQKEVIIPKLKGEPLGVVIVESGWGSMVPTVVLANMAPGGSAARCGQLNIGDQIMSINGISLVGLPLSTCQSYIKASRNEILVRLMIVSCTPVVEVLVKRPDIKYQLGFSVQNGVICSLLRGGIAERGGVRVGHRIIEINGQSVVAVPHDKIVTMLASSVGEIHMKTMQTSIYRLLTGQDTPHYI